MTSILLAVLLAAATVPAKGGLDTAKIDQITGMKGSLDAASGVYKVSAPRGDLAVVVGGVHVTPAMGLTSWAAFHATGKEAMVMGDIVLADDQVNPVMSAALDNGLEVTALHNHFLGASPNVMFMHVGGHGSVDTLAKGVKAVFAKLAETEGGKGEHRTADIDPAKTTLDPMKIEAVLGVKGALASGVYKVTIGRDTKMHGIDAGAAMGVNTWAAFAGSDDEAVVDGDFAMHEDELQGVLKALRAANIDVVAIHQHMTGESPRILFLHYWGIGKTEDLAKGLKSALAKTNGGRG